MANLNRLSVIMRNIDDETFVTFSLGTNRLFITPNGTKDYQYAIELIECCKDQEACVINTTYANPTITTRSSEVYDGLLVLPTVNLRRILQGLVHIGNICKIHLTTERVTLGTSLTDISAQITIERSAECIFSLVNAKTNSGFSFYLDISVFLKICTLFSVADVTLFLFDVTQATTSLLLISDNPHFKLEFTIPFLRIE